MCSPLSLPHIPLVSDLIASHSYLDVAKLVLCVRCKMQTQGKDGLREGLSVGTPCTRVRRPETEQVSPQRPPCPSSAELPTTNCCLLGKMSVLSVTWSFRQRDRVLFSAPSFCPHRMPSVLGNCPPHCACSQTLCPWTLVFDDASTTAPRYRARAVGLTPADCGE